MIPFLNLKNSIRPFAAGCSVLFLFLFPHASWAGESSIRGRIIDASTREPVYFVNVFISNTTRGVTSSVDGEFSLTVSDPGNYELIIHHIAYEPQVIPLDLLIERQLNLVIELVPGVLKGKQVEIYGTRDKYWNKHLEEFSRVFLGETENSGQCFIINPGVLDFRKEGDTLLAFTDSLVHIDNRTLGYQIDLFINHFYSDSEHKKYQIYPIFIKIPYSDRETAARWRRNRLRAYSGSFRHFIAALYKAELSDEGFELYEVKQVGKTIYTWGSTDRIHDESVFIDSSAFKDFKTMRLGGHFMVLSHEIPRKTDLFIEEARKAEFNALEMFEPSFFSMSGEALIDSLGNVQPSSVFLLSGYWRLYGMADMLPFDYCPERDNE
jgi:hypothetical protein